MSGDLPLRSAEIGRLAVKLLIIIAGLALGAFVGLLIASSTGLIVITC